MKVTLYIGLIIAISQLAGCGSVLFRADFEADMVGQGPSSNPAGSPSGDRIHTTIPTDSTSLRVYANRSGNADNQKVLSFFKYRPLARPRFVNFTTKGIDDLERSITAVWTAKIERSINEELEISFVGYQYNKIATIKLVSGKVYYRVDNGLRLLGDMADNEIHTVVWKINPIAQTHSLIISGGGTAIELQDEPIQTSAIAYLQNDQKSISMIYPGEDSGAINYTISKLRIAYSDEDEEE